MAACNGPLAGFRCGGGGGDAGATTTFSTAACGPLPLLLLVPPTVTYEAGRPAGCFAAAPPAVEHPALLPRSPHVQ